ncbi:putative quinol monooxygenase [Spirosoma lituiforme]
MENKTVYLISTFTVKPEDQTLYEQTLAKQLAITKDEPHVLGYEVFRQADGSYLQHERYVDEAGIWLHVQNTMEPLTVWSSIATTTHMMVLGPVGPDFKQKSGLDNVVNYQHFAEVPR